MKSKTISQIEIEPETITEITETESEEVQGGENRSCIHFSCNKPK